ncbi:DUF4192 family protein [Glycomyces sp. MUSA5-2]|uniref:DUF4192 family protein n=1 Tax=Glycomyces sp. MUSA5-2 TaxID=2053002 RepID=UPI00300908C7
MNLQAYGISGVLDTRTEAELIGLVPYILERHPKEELVILGAYGGEPRAWTAWPLAALDAGEPRSSIARTWASEEFDQLHFIAYSADTDAAATRLNGLHDQLRDTGCESVDPARNLVVTGRSWGYAAFGGLLDAYEGTGTITAPDPAQGRIEGLMFRAACRKRYALARLRPRDAASAAKAARIAIRCRTNRADAADPLAQAEADERCYHRALRDPRSLNTTSAVALGVAVAANTDLAATAIDDISSGHAHALEVWTEAARHATGTDRAPSTALAALAAWQAGDDAAAAFAEAAVDADSESVLAWAAVHLIGTGIQPGEIAARGSLDAEEAAA